MKILAIRLKNLASMEGPTEIDFTCEPLCSAGIFAITGPTGAGKSTILDAICLALYAKTPRYAQGKESGIDIKELNQGDVRGILRNGTGEGYAEVDFVGIDHKKYRATWAVKRARSKVEGAIQKDTLTLKDIDSGIVISAMKSEACREIERMVGLSFDQFTRSVLLAQGDFTAFLKADNNDKASLLEKLTGTNIYSKISQQVFNNYKVAQSEIDKLKAQLNVVEILTDEQVEAVRLQQLELNNEIKALQQQLEEVLKEVQWQERMVELKQHTVLALTAVDSAKKEKLAASGRFNKLKLVEEVQYIRSTYELHQSLHDQYCEECNQLERARKEFGALQFSLSGVESSIELLSKELNESIECRTEALPQLEEARRLDIQLSAQEKNVLSFKKEWNEATGKLIEKQELLTETQKRLHDIQGSIKSLEQWKKTNIDREPIAMNIVLIRTKLEEASRLLTSTAEVASLMKSKKDDVIRGELHIEKLSNDLSASAKQLSGITREQDDLISKIRTASFSELESSKKEFEQLLQKFIPARASWKLLYEKRSSLRDNKNYLKEIIEERKKCETLLLSIDELLPVAIEKKNASAQRLSKAKLEISANVESLRTQLNEGDACPVCGSQEHPYTKHHPQVAGIFNLLEKEADEDFQNWSEMINKKHVLIDTSKKLDIDLQRLEFNASEIAKNVEELDREWKGYRLENNSLPESEILQWLDSTIKQYQHSYNQLDKQVSEYLVIEKKCKEKDREFSEVDRKHQALMNEIELESGKVESNRIRLLELGKEFHNKETELSNIISGLSIYFSQTSWYIKWKEAPADFTKKMEAFEREWCDKLSELDKADRAKTLLEHSISQLSVQVNDQQAIDNKKAQEFEESNRTLQSLRLHRNNLFNGAPLQKVETDLQRNIDEVLLKVEKEKSSKQKISQDIAASNSLIEQLVKSISIKKIRVEELMHKINTWIDGFNASREIVLDMQQLKILLDHSHDWLEKERNFINAINRIIIESEANLKDREQEMHTHSYNRKDARELEILNPAKEKLHSDKIIKEELLMQLRIQLENDTSNKKRAGKLFSQIETATKQADDWSKLNEMIGSADGKKFRQVAQEYTLDVLLGYANAHLKMLSKRYHLNRIADTLGLMVLDKDMGNDERTVVSLSGGESFLVSLALALGLASLSSSRMQVESLFIDEGFGSLDPATMNIAMDALERLHNQGRKVGVISHVQEMQERISTQIKVIKQSGGKSIVTVVNGLN